MSRIINKACGVASRLLNLKPMTKEEEIIMAITDKYFEYSSDGVYIKLTHEDVDLDDYILKRLQFYKKELLDEILEHSSGGGSWRRVIEQMRD